jgi:hypothetical protein
LRAAAELKTTASAPERDSQACPSWAYNRRKAAANGPKNDGEIAMTIRSSAAALALLAVLGIYTTSSIAAPMEITPIDAKASPESIAMGPDGSLYLGAQAAAVVYRAKPGAATANLFIDMRADKAQFVLGVFADAQEKTLWVCEIGELDHSSPLLKGRNTVLRAFDIDSGAPKARYPLPGDTNLCNDATFGPDHSLYLSDTSNGKILRLRPGAKEFETVIQDPGLYGVDGLTFLKGVLYVNTVWSNNLYRIPMDASGKAGKPQQLMVSQLLTAPDGMRAAGGRLFLAENAAGKVDMVTIKGDRATVTTIKSGLNAPTAVEPAGNTLWIGDRGASKAIGIPMPK